MVVAVGNRMFLGPSNPLWFPTSEIRRQRTFDKDKDIESQNVEH